MSGFRASSSGVPPRVLTSLPWSIEQTSIALVRAGVFVEDARVLQAQDVDGGSLALLSDAALQRMGVGTFGRRAKILTAVQGLLDAEAEKRGLIAPNVLGIQVGPASPKTAAGASSRDPYAPPLPRGASASDPFLRSATSHTAPFQPMVSDRFYDDDNLLDPAALTPAVGVVGPRTPSPALDSTYRTRDFGVGTTLPAPLDHGISAAQRIENANMFARATAKSSLARSNLHALDRSDIDRDREAEEEFADAADDYDSDIDRHFHHPRLDTQVAAYDPRAVADPTDPFLHHDPASRVRPWLGSIVPPSRVPAVSTEPPARRLQLEWVHGYRAFDSRSNLVYNTAGDIIYPVAGLVVVYTPRLRRQRFFFGHNDDVRCLTQHPLDKNLIASGQSGGLKDGVSVPPHICVWDSSSGDLTRAYTLQCTSTDKSIHSVGFSGGEGRFLASVSSDAHHSLKVWDWKKRLLMTTAKSDTNPVYMVRGNPKDDAEFVTVGKAHVLFWTWDGHVLKNRRGVIGGAANNDLPSFYAVTFSEKGYACLGADNGSIYVFVGGKAAKTFSGVHRGKILSLEWYQGGFVSGGSDGRVHILDRKMDVAKTMQFSNKVTSVFVGGPHGDDALLVGTQGADVFEVVGFMDATIEGDERLEAVTRGHSDGELYALAMAADGKHYVTAGEDNTLCLWSLEAHRLLKRGILSDRKGHVISSRRSRTATTSTHPINQCARSIALSPSGSEILVGTNEGELVVFDTRTFARKLGVPLAPYKQQLRNAVDGATHPRREGASSRAHWISAIQFSPSGHAVAVGTHGCVVVLLDATAGFAVRAVLDLSTAPITSLDWSADGTLLRTNDGAFELRHYHVDEQDLKATTPITNATSVRDVQWATHTCVLAWASSGATQPQHQGQFVNTVDASPSRSLLATGDDSGHVNLLRYPALPGAQPLVYAAHSAHVTLTRFSPDERFLVTAGGHDLSLCQWAVL